MSDKRIFNIETLNALGSRLFDHAENVLARRDIAEDMRQAARACDRLASLRFAVGEIATKTTDAATARDLIAALAAAEGE